MRRTSHTMRPARVPAREARAALSMVVESDTSPPPPPPIRVVRPSMTVGMSKSIDTVALTSR